MNKENNKLGRGLSSLLSGDAINDNKEVLKILNISAINSNKQQPRKKFNEKELEELAASIKSKGILQPIVVRKKTENTYEIIAGERRWRAAQIAGLHEVPTIIKEMSDNEVLQAALIENIQRENLNPVEEAKAFRSILENIEISPEKLANLVGKSRSHISNTVRLLELDNEILNFVEDGKLSMGHARTLIGVSNALELAKEIIDKKLSVRDVEKNTSQFKKTRKNKKNQKDLSLIHI